MTFNEYQNKSKETVLNNSYDRIEYYAIGLGDEAGEVLGKVKKLWRDRNFEVDDEFRDMLANEMGDVLWYMAQMARVADIEFEIVAQANLNKIFSRQARGLIHGDGDNR
jgi:NTP pyrophosphatase (non-canonical NTP hydrolase)